MIESLRWAPYAALVGTLLGCGAGAHHTPTGDDGGWVDAGPEELLVGSGGVDTFATVNDGDTVRLSMGCQGLQHVWVGLRTAGVAAGPANVSLTLRRSDDDVLVSDDFQVRLRFVDRGDYRELLGLRLVIPDADAAVGKDGVLTAHVTEVGGAHRTVSAELHVHVEWGTEVCRGGQ